MHVLKCCASRRRKADLIEPGGAAAVCVLLKSHSFLTTEWVLVANEEGYNSGG